MIPEAQNSEVVLNQESIALFVGSLPPRFVMLTAVNFNNESRRVTREVDDNSVDRNLTSKMKPSRLQ